MTFAFLHFCLLFETCMLCMRGGGSAYCGAALRHGDVTVRWLFAFHIHHLIC